MHPRMGAGTPTGLGSLPVSPHYKGIKHGGKAPKRFKNIWKESKAEEEKKSQADYFIFS